MTKMAVRKLSFIGGSLRPPGAVVNFDDEKLKPRDQRKRKPVRQPDGGDMGANLVPVDGKESIAITAMAAIAPTGPNPTMPQQVPAGTVQLGSGYYQDGAKLVAEGSQAEASAPEASETMSDVIEEEGAESAINPDAEDDRPSLSGMNKAQLRETATTEGVDWTEDMTNAELTEAITAMRG